MYAFCGLMQIISHGSVVIATTNHFLDSRPEQDSVLVLSSVAALDVDKRRVVGYNATLDQIVQAQQVLFMAQAVQISPTER